MKKKLTETRVDLPIAQMRAEISPKSYDAESKTVELVWTTGKKGLRSGIDGNYFEELSMNPKAIRMGRLQSGATPFMDSHRTNGGSGAVVGVVESARIEGGQGIARIRLADTADVASTVRKIETGILKNVSVGYNVYRYERQPDGNSDDTPTYLATDWEPTEISIVPVGFDENAVMRGQDAAVVPCVVVNNESQGSEMGESDMTEEQKRELEQKQAAEAKRIADEAAKAARESEKVRQAEIRAVFAKVGLDAAQADKAIAEDHTVDQARAMVIDLLAEKQKETVPAIRGAVSATGGAPAQQQERRAGIENAILHRAGSVKELTEAGKNFRGMSLLRIAEDCIAAEGGSVRGMSAMEVATRAFASTGDFANILANVLNKSLRKSYDEAPKTFEPLVRVTEVADFKAISRTQLSNAPALELLGENGEFKRGKMTDAAEGYVVKTYGKTMGISRQALINDDLSAFSRIPEAFGRSAASLESDVVWALLTANANMADGVALFQAATHKNYVASGAAPSIATLTAMRSAFRLQKGLDGARLLNLIPKYLIVPAALEQTALQVVSPDMLANTVGNINTFKGLLSPIVEPRLDANSATAWYGACDPGQNDVIEMAYLSGQRGVYSETKMGWEVDGIEVKARIDFGAKVIDWRSLYKNNGA